MDWANEAHKARVEVDRLLAKYAVGGGIVDGKAHRLAIIAANTRLARAWAELRKVKRNHVEDEGR